MDKKNPQTSDKFDKNRILQQKNSFLVYKNQIHKGSTRTIYINNPLEIKQWS